MSSQPKRDKSYKEALEEKLEEQALVAEAEASPVVLDEPPYLMAPSSKALEEEMLSDPSFPWEDGEKPSTTVIHKKRGPALSEDQQMQLAVWIATGFTYADTVPWQMKEWGFAVTRQTWTYYRQVRTDLTVKAAKWVTSQYERYGYANPAVRLARLDAHARRLDRYMEKRGLYETEIHIIGGRGGAREVTSEKFAKDLSAEWRATIAQIEKMTDAPKRLADAGSVNGVSPAIDEGLAQRILTAKRWEPGRKTKEEAGE